MSDDPSRARVLGWREWLTLPELGLAHIKAKVDTGARTSTLHAFYVDTFRRSGQLYARFGVHPVQHRSDILVHAEAAVIDRRRVSDSGGHREERYVISTMLDLAGHQWPIELTLTNRESMLFRMLLGRTAIAGNAVVDPARSFVAGRVRQPWVAYGAGPSDERTD